MKSTFDSQQEKEKVISIFHRLWQRAENGKVLATEGDIHSFEAFWEHVPRKDAKKKAKTAYEALTATKRKLCFEGMKVYKTMVSKSGTEAIMLPTTFINGERWNDAGIVVRNPAYESSPRDTQKLSQTRNKQAALQEPNLKARHTTKDTYEASDTIPDFREIGFIPKGLD